MSDWCFVRGQNLLIPHAFYYSVRGPRLDERPPDVGPNSEWWSNYKTYADACRRLSWLNTDSKQVCDLAILCEANYLPDKSARILYEHQRDFNYLEIRSLLENAKTDSKGVHIAGMDYSVLVIDSLSEIPPLAIHKLKILAANGRLIVNRSSGYSQQFKGALVYNTPESFTKILENIGQPDLQFGSPSKDIRYRHVIKGSDNYFIIFNEGRNEVSSTLILSENGNRQLLNPCTSEAVGLGKSEIVSFKPFELKIVRVYR